ncbi:hypothetical protein [Pseudonocardia lacus]|uniref:hypothetical protein n=1 Tax=Pseudonocardia lacus TaxID=2835865 RepID=UPI001BDD97BD|nr:hypothetical protein [Pseudonocardia lacus]
MDAGRNGPGRNGPGRDEPGRDEPGRDEPGRDEPGREPDGEPDGDGSTDPTNLVRLTPAERPAPTLTAMCCVHAYREASGRIWYRITVTPDVTRPGSEVTSVQSQLSAVLADVRTFLRDVDRTAPT